MDSPVNASNACLACRKIKVRCCITADSSTGVCVRCERKGIECVFQKHRRGRKPGTRVSKARSAVPLSGPGSWPTPVSEPSHTEAVPASCVIEPGTVTSPPVSGPQRPALENTDGLQPSGLFNYQKGKFSLRQILCDDEGGTLERTRESSPAQVAVADDPIRLGLVNDALARSLFDNFMRDLNPYICQLDPDLHTFNYVRKQSLFLLTSILAATAKAFNPILYKPLYDHAQELFNEAFAKGVYSVETAQAILLLTYWKEPQDNRAWTTLGYVIRMCVDMGWHRLSPPNLSSRMSLPDSEVRKLRNIERTWLVLFVYDRSLSLQTGRPWMIERSDFIEGAEAWCHNPLATDDDLLLSAFVTLRLETCDTFSSLSRGYRPGDRTSLGSTNSLLALCQDRIQRWEARWTQSLKDRKQSSDKNHCHYLLLRFYGTHAKLQLCSLPLQSILASGDGETTPGSSILWSAYTSALTMLQLIQKYSSSVYFAQDSLHVMTAYSAAFLLKLLLFAPSDIVKETEAAILQAIDAAAKVFTEQQAPANSSCALQAKFLRRIASKIDSQRSDRQRRAGVFRTTNDQNAIAVYSHSNMPALEDGQAGLTPRVQRPFDGFGPPSSDRQEQTSMLSDEDSIWNEWFATAGFGTEEAMFLA